MQDVLSHAWRWMFGDVGLGKIWAKRRGRTFLWSQIKQPGELEGCKSVTVTQSSEEV